jgi:hypothetical protein
MDQCESTREELLLFVPAVGALLGVAACLVCPWPGSARLIPVAVLADVSVAIWVWWFATVVLGKLRGSRPR